MRRGILPGFVIVLAGAMLSVGAPPAFSAWSPSALVPGTQPDDAGIHRTSVGLAASGDLAIAWADRVATRRAGVWTTTVLPGNPSGRPELAMNERGDIAVAWMQGSRVCVGYRPAVGAWSFPSGQCPQSDFAVQTPFVTINDNGDTLATWVGPANAVFASLGTDGVWEDAKQVSPGSPFVLSLDPPRFNAPAALDNTGSALVLWADQYGFREPAASTGPVHGVRQSLRSAGAGSWGAPSAITPRSSNDTVSPDYQLVDVAADPVSGNLAVGLCCFDNSRLPNSGATRFGNGTVAGGANFGAQAQAGEVAFDVAAARGRVAATGVKRPITGDQSHVAKGKVVAAGGTPSPDELPSQPDWTTTSGTSYPVVAVGPDGTALVAYQSTFLWRAGPGGVFSTGPTWPFVPTPGETIDLAVNCAGDGLAASVETDAKVHYSEFPGSSTAACTESPGPPDTSVPPGAGAVTGTTTPPGNTTPANTTPPADTTAPAALLSGATSQKAGSTISVIVSCGSEVCKATPSGSANVPGASKLFKLGGATRQVGARRNATLKLRVPAKGLRAIRKALRRKRKVVATIRVRVTDSAGNTRAGSRRVKLKR